MSFSETNDYGGAMNECDMSADERLDSYYFS